MGTPGLGRATAVVEIMRAAALAGQPAPGNAEVARLLGITSTGTASEALARAEAIGLIVVQRGQNFRIVSAPDGAWRTAGALPEGVAHTRRGQGVPRAHRKRGPGQKSAAAVKAAWRNQVRRPGRVVAPGAHGRQSVPPLGAAAPSIPALAGDPGPLVTGQVAGAPPAASGVSFRDETAPAALVPPGAFSRDEGCRFPIGDVRAPGFRFCCAPRAVYPGSGRRSAYCFEHHMVCYRVEEAA